MTCKLSFILCVLLLVYSFIGESQVAHLLHCCVLVLLFESTAFGIFDIKLTLLSDLYCLLSTLVRYYRKESVCFID